MIRAIRFVTAAALLVLGAQAVAQAPAATPPASKPISTSLGMVVFPAKGQTPQQQAAQQATQQQQQAAQQQTAAQQQQMDLFRKGFAACLEPKGYTVK
jgi:predicted component of type VI protein secretion system